MILKKNDWKVRLYLWSLSYRCDFHAKYYNEPYRTNLCEFMRGILVWLPLTLLIQLTAMFSIVYALVIYPIMRLGGDFWKVPAWVIGFPALACALVIGIIYVVEKLKDHFFSRPIDDRYQTWEEKMQKAREKELAFERSLPGIILTWLKARKASICPIIDLEDVD